MDDKHTKNVANWKKEEEVGVKKLSLIWQVFHKTESIACSHKRDIVTFEI